MSEKTHADAETAGDTFAFFRNTVAIGIFKQPEVRDVGEPNLAVAGQYAGRESVYLTIEAVGKNRGLVEDTVIVRVDQQAYPVRVVS